MLLKVLYFRQRLVKKHIDDTLMRRKVMSRKKRKLRGGHIVQRQNEEMQKEIPTIPRPMKQGDEILVMPLIEYATIWDDAASVDPKDFLRGIPTVSAIEFIVSQQNKVVYAPSDLQTQAQMIGQLMQLFGGKEADAIGQFVQQMTQRGQGPILIDNNSCLHFYLLALQCFEPSDRPLDADDCRNIYKAYLYCSHVWLEQQQRNIKGLGLTDLSLLIDLPVVEFKTYKDFKAQLYKATRFFNFCNNNSHFGQFAQWFLADKGVSNASEYLGRIFHLFCFTAKDPTPVNIKVTAEMAPDVTFFDQFVINPAGCKQLWDNKDLNYLRNHFILKRQDVTTGEITLTILNPALLSDKLYQSMMFDLSDSVIKHGGGNYKGKPFKSKGDFNAFVGEEFSEQQILYDVMDLAYPTDEVLRLNGSYLKSKGVTGEIDYCMMEGGQLFLFEYKDVMMRDETKHSSDLALIKETIFDRICKYEKKHKKGVGQLLYNVNRVFNAHLLDGLGVDPSKVKEVFLVVVTTDTAFNAIGVNALVKEEFARIMGDLDFSVTVKINEPVIIDFETLFGLIIPLREKQIGLGKLIHQYNVKTNRSGSVRMLPFNGYVKDSSMIPLLQEKDVPVLFGDFLAMVKKELN